MRCLAVGEIGMKKFRLARIGIYLMIICGAIGALPVMAYTSAGDRSFPATILLPQIAPSDEFYATAITQPLQGGARQTSLTAVYDKSITDRFGVSLTEGYSLLDQNPGPNATGWQNTVLGAQYTAVIDRDAEFLLAVGVEREFGGSGASTVAASTGATQPAITFGKGLGDLDIGYLRPLAISGLIGYQFSDNVSLRPGEFVFGAAVEYSFPYLESKVAALDLPDVVRSLTPIVEFTLNAPSGGSGGPNVATVAPGIASTGAGWDFGIEATVPATRAAGSGVGVAVQLHLSLDYLLADSIGKPLFDFD
jgi:hypothetical protein